jgi:predicted porin
MFNAHQAVPTSPARPRRTSPRTVAGARGRAALLVAAAAGFCADLHAVDFGPFSLNGFAKAEIQRTSNYCPDCSLEPEENKQRAWADALQYGREYGTETVHLTLFQPYLGFKYALGGGFKFDALLSQRWRDGDEDIPGFWYDKSIALSHEDYGSVRIGAMTTRSWSVADYPYGTYLNVSDQWASSGAGYGLLTRAVRITSRPLDVFDGDLVLEATYDIGESGWNKNKPWLLELYAQYHRGDLVVDAMIQDSRNGTPSAWGHGPFTGLTPFPQDDSRLGSSGQSIAMAMARYSIDLHWQVGGGIRFNRWSGAYAQITKSAPGQLDQWNNMFNVDWWCKSAVPARCDVDNPGYSARSTDVLLGLRYRTGPWTASTGMVYLGEASTDNPSERGQSNSTLYNTVGLSYDWGHGLQLYGFAGIVHYGQLGLSAMSMPGNSSFSGVDSRVSRNGNWFGLGALFVF